MCERYSAFSILYEVKPLKCQVPLLSDKIILLGSIKCLYKDQLWDRSNGFEDTFGHSKIGSLIFTTGNMGVENEGKIIPAF